MLREVVSHVYQLDVPQSSVFFLLDERVTLVDAGTRWSAKRILEALGELGRSPADLERILITHYHFDHWGSLAKLLKRTPAEVCVHSLDAPYLSGHAGPPVATPRLRPFRALARLLSRFFAPPVPVSRTFEGGEVLPVLGGLHVVHTPGHTRGHVAYYLPELRVLLSGDAVQLNRQGHLIPPTVFEDRDEAIRSLGRMAELDFEVLAPSHFPPLRGVREQLRRLASSR
jgi:glyoxylase-like metal-dependent hydrolase (beta-lactamase superfamily II)